MVHRPRVTRHQAETAEGEAYVFVMSCRCGVRGSPRIRRGEAAADREQHCRAVAAPEADRCQRLEEHRLRWWDACLLCSAQMSLFELEEVTRA